MRRALSVAFLTAIMVCGFGLVGISRFGTVQAATEITGIITSDTTWTKANSPYNLTGNVLIDSGVTVTVEADAVVNLNGYYIRVNGTLIIQPGVTFNMRKRDTSEGYVQSGTVGFITVNGLMTARGTTAKPIHFNGDIYTWDSIGAPPAISGVGFADTSTPWNEITGSGCVVEYSVFDNKVALSARGHVKISNNKISRIGISDGSTVISNNEVSDGITIIGGSPIVVNNVLNGGYIDVFESARSPIITGNVISYPKSIAAKSTGIAIRGSFNDNDEIIVENNIITNCVNGIEVLNYEYGRMRKPITIRHNSIRLSEVGILIDGDIPQLSVRENTIIDNEVGIAITYAISPTIANNNINGNKAGIELSKGASRDVNATLNWWGTTDTTSISQYIHDFEDDFNLGRVTFIPFLTSPDPNATPDPNAPIPTPTPEQTPVTSPTPTPTPSEEPQQTGQIEPIVVAAIVLAIFFAVPAVLIYLIKRK